MSVTAPSSDPPPPGTKPEPPAVRIVEPAPTVSPDAPAAEPAPPPAPAPAPAAAEAPRPERETSRLRRLLTVGGTLFGLFVAYQILVYFVAYTDDAYVRSDLVAVASEVTGPILQVHVVDNQDIKKGDPLFTIDPQPFQLIVNQRQAQIDEQRALLKVSQEELSSSQAALAASTSAHTYAQQQQVRYADLAKSEYAPRAELDKANDDLRRTAAEMRISEFAIEKARNGIVAHQAALNLAMAEMATAQWALGKTQVDVADRWVDHQPYGAQGRHGQRQRADHRHRRCPRLAHHGQLQAGLHTLLHHRRHGLGLARQPAIPSSPRPHRRHRPRLQPRSRGR